MFQILLAPNAFKGCLDATEICTILQDELRSVPDCRTACFPLGDGGDGTASLLASYMGAHSIPIRTTDPVGRIHQTEYHRQGDTAIIELAAICGLKLLKPQEYDVLNANTVGLGKAINEAVKDGCTHILLCIGGSASIDGGTGALAEMGMTIVKGSDKHQNHIIDILDIDTFILKKKFKDISFTILCDVDNPLLGTSGAATVFAPQKGASPLQVSLLENSLSRYAQILKEKTAKEVTTVKHGGAAGGIGAAFHALLDARLESGADYCIRKSGFMEHLDATDLVITGEGKIDGQTLCGKIPGVVARLCHQHGVEVVAIAGRTEDKVEGFSQILTLGGYAGNPETSFLNPEPYLRMAAQDIRKYYLSSRQIQTIK